MAWEFTFSKLNKLGDFDDKYGQSYWGETNQQLEPVKFNSMNQNITVNDKISAEESVMKKSAKGTEYSQLRKVQVVGVAPAAAPTAQATAQPEPRAASTDDDPFMKGLKAVYVQNKEILAILKGETVLGTPMPQPTAPAAPSEPEDEVYPVDLDERISLDGAEPFNASDIPF